MFVFSNKETGEVFVLPTLDNKPCNIDIFTVAPIKTEKKILKYFWDKFNFKKNAKTNKQTVSKII